MNDWIGPWTATNLLAETRRILWENHRHTEEVLWVGPASGEHCVSWSVFAEVASTADYDAGYGAVYIRRNLVVVGVDWWLERYEYDGWEGWVYKERPIWKNDDVVLTVWELEG